ncbi:hypothetical protein [Endozoicomonas ascidiicola]|uniref:hypothetical protein n=1 Tax=Endozoicomonas ascidiicola TaxID=1698521 RepID=UPI0008297128|nr:hypothetical protein [Endozoicomonas ascidiicola]
MDGKLLSATENTHSQMLSGATELKMSHIEIASVAGKRSDNVKRTIERLVKEGAIASPQIEERPKQGVSGQFVEHLLLDRLDSITAMASIDGNYCADLVLRWDNLESGRATPAAHLKEAPTNEQELPTPQTLLEINMNTSLKAIAFAEALGFTGNQKLLSADRLLKSQIGFSPLEAMGQKQLVAPVQAMTFTPTQLGQMMTPPEDPRHVNKLLEAAGLQIKIDSQWVPTDQGKPLCEILDTGKSHNSGTPVKQVKWYQSVLDQLRPAHPDQPETESLNQDCHYADPTMVGSETDHEPVQRKQKRKRNRYELDDYFSLVELGDFIGRSRQHVVEVLEKHRIIKWTGQGKKGKYLLSSKGWSYGLMYDPTEQAFHNYNSKRLTTSNAQPVLTYDILTFF